MTTNLHAHIDTSSLDCDGPLYTSRVESLSDEERAEHEESGGVNDFHDIHFKDRVLSLYTFFSSEGGQRIEISQSGMEITEQTEEGHRNVSVRWCEDETCDPHARFQRDVYAEQMGY